jgi:hypothetical protein
VFWPTIHATEHSFLGGRDVVATFGVSVGQLLRPGLLLILQLGLVVLNLQDIFGPRPGPLPRNIATGSVAGATPTL